MSKKDDILKGFQAFGRSLMLPIATIAAVGILYGLTAALSRPQVAELLPFLNNEIIYYILFLIRNLSGKIFDLIPVLFAISIALGLAKEEKEISAMASFIGYYVMHWSSSYLLASELFTLDTSGLADILGITGTLQMGAVGGMIVGLMTAYLHNKYYKIELPVAIAFFGGKRFVSIAVILWSLLLGQILPFVWIPISSFINMIGVGIAGLGQIGVFLYGFLERLLIPTGLHHILNGIFRTTPAGGVYEGVEGVWNIFFEFFESVDISVLKPFTAFMAQGKIPYMMFGLPAAALAIYRTTPPEKKKAVKALMIAGTLASFTTGITEPLEFSFLFIAPALFIFHSIMGGLSFVLMSLLNVGIGNTQGGVIDLLVYGIMVPGSNWYFAVIVGLAYGLLYYNVFKWYLKKKQITVDVSEEIIDDSPQTGTVDRKIVTIIEALGGRENIVQINNCFTRLRVDIKDMKYVEEDVLKATGAMGIVKPSDTHIQVIYGPKVDAIASKVKLALK
ncbi:MAG: PTS transporter subunit EIIC [Clostridiaceae bacterium]